MTRPLPRERACRPSRPDAARSGRAVGVVLVGLAVRPAQLLLLWSVLAVAANVQAQVVTIDWDAAGKFDRELAVPAGKFVELCAKLEPGINVAWRFSAPAALDFNIHYHVGNQVRMPAQEDQSRSASGVLVVASSEDYCWMWANKTSMPSTVAVQLSRSSPASR